MNNLIVHLIRHGEVYNPKQVLYGRLPKFPLSEKGKKCIHQTADFFKTRKIRAIYSSPLLRTRQTAGILSKALSVEPYYSAYLLEVKLLFQGISLEKFKKEIQPYIYSDKYLSMGQESVEEILKRMQTVLGVITKTYDKGEVIIVSHGDPIVIVQSWIQGHKFTWQYKKDNYLKTGEWITITYDRQKENWKKINI